MLDYHKSLEGRGCNWKQSFGGYADDAMRVSILTFFNNIMVSSEDTVILVNYTCINPFFQLFSVNDLLLSCKNTLRGDISDEQKNCKRCESLAVDVCEIRMRENINIILGLYESDGTSTVGFGLKNRFLRSSHVSGDARSPASLPA